MNRLIILFLIISIISCNKGFNCEQWSYYDDCKAKSPDVSCSYSRLYHKGVLCDKDKKRAKKGDTIILQDDENFLRTRYFIEKLSN